jgi:hypothetical protein
VPFQFFLACGRARENARVLARRDWVGENNGLFEHPLSKLIQDDA